MKNKLKVAGLAVFAGVILPAQAAVISMSGTNQGRDQSLIDFMTTNFQDVTVQYGDYSNPANIPVDTDIFVVGRSFSSTPYANSGNSATFNALTMPVVAFSTYVARPDSGRWGWHDGAASGGWDVTGDETSVTAAGTGIFGVAEGAADWFTAPAGANFWATGTGSVGEGQVLATLGGDILAAGWNAGELSGTGATFGGDRLLFNLPQDSNYTVVPGTAAGQEALVNAMSEYTGLVAIPEPTTIGLVGVMGGGLLFVRRRFMM